MDFIDDIIGQGYERFIMELEDLTLSSQENVIKQVNETTSGMILTFDTSVYMICLLRLLILTLLDYGIMLRNAKCLEL